MMKKTYIKSIVLSAWSIALGLAVGTLTSCSEDLDVSDSIKELTDGNIELTISIPDETVVQTRDSQSDLEKAIGTTDYTHYVLVYNKDNSENPTTLAYKQSVPGLTENSVITLNLSKTLAQNPYIVVVANLPSGENVSALSIGSEFSDLNSLTHNISSGQPSSPFIMSGVATAVTGQSNKYKAELHRSAAKVSIATSTAVKNFTLKGYTMYNAPSVGNYTAHIIKVINDEARFHTGTNTYEGTSQADGSFLNYSYPVKSLGSSVNISAANAGAYFIVEGEFEEETCYYRVDLKNGSEYYNLEPNHWYEVKITSVLRKGYSTPQDAAIRYMGQEDTAIIGVEIHDHSNNVLNMISDGIHELGVSRDIEIDTNIEGMVSSKDFVVRVYCGENNGGSHYPNFQGQSLTGSLFSPSDDKTGFSVEIIDGNSWMSLSKVEDISGDSSEVSDPDNPSSGSSTGTPESNGKRWKYTVNFDTSKAIGGEMAGVIRVSWLGLYKDINVTYIVAFNPTPTIMNENTVLIMHNSNNNQSFKIEYYWKFLAGNTVSVAVPSNISSSTINSQLKGVDKTAMGPEKVRNEGFHFPVMYGKESSDPWWYEYQIPFFTNDILKNYKTYSVSVRQGEREITGANGVWGTNNFKITRADAFGREDFDEIPVTRRAKITLEEDQGAICLVLKRANVDSSNKGISGISNDFEYSTAELVVTLFADDSDTEGTEFKVNLYHTGFFHLPLITSSTDWSMFKSGEEDENNRQNYFYYEVVSLNGQHWLDRNLGATGAGQYIENDNGNNLYSTWPFCDGAKGSLYRPGNGTDYKNEIEGDVKHGICPPGFRIPKKQEWDNIRLSSAFHNIYSGDYYDTYMDCDNSEAGIVYFPKARFLENLSGFTTNGDLNTGYYWTSSKAQGMEKAHIGHWLKVMCITSSSSFINGQMDNTARYVRAVSANEGNPVSIDSYTTSFNVQYATHVYLYRYNEDGSRAGAFGWPGKAVGNYETMKKSFNFNYSSTWDPDDSVPTYVLFAFVAADGSIKTISSNGESDPQKAKGWKVKNGLNYYFDSSGNLSGASSELFQDAYKDTTSTTE